jgi:hypothetical protein
MLLLWVPTILGGSCLVGRTNFSRDFSFLDTGKLRRVHPVFGFLSLINIQRLLTTWLVMHFNGSSFGAWVVVHQAYVGIIGVLGLLVSMDELLVVRGRTAHLLVSLTAEVV